MGGLSYSSGLLGEGMSPSSDDKRFITVFVLLWLATLILALWAGGFESLR